MRVSLVIPMHDAQETIAATLRSALNQTRPPDEIIVVDDASGDGGPGITEGFGPPVTVHRVAFRNGAAARKAGAEYATGDALMFLDADDLLGPTVLQELVAALERRPGEIACCPWQRFELRNGCWRAGPSSCPSRGRDQDDLEAWLTGWYHPPCSVLWSREAYEASGGWDPSVAVNQDGDVMMRAFISGARLVPTAGGVAYYRRSAGGAVSVSGRRFSADGLRSRLEVLDRIGDRLAAAGRGLRYAPALHEAYRSVARDAADGERQRAEQAAGRYAKASGRRLPRGDAAARRSLRLKPHDGGPPPPEIRLRPAPDIVEPAPERPLVSIIIPTYNRSDLLQRALRSVLAQTYDRFEALIVDDGSDEDIAAVVAGFDDPRLVHLRQPGNLGVAAARNRGLGEARGELIAFLDSDDRWEPHKLQAQVDILMRRPHKVGLIYSGVAAENERGERTLTIPTERGDVFRDMLWRNVVHFGTSSVVIRREVVNTVGLFDETLPAIEDYDYWIRIARFYEFEFAPDHLIVYDNRAPQTQAKRSGDFAANMKARRLFAERYAWEAAQAGVLHRYLLESARKELEHPSGRSLAGAYHLLKAVRWQPKEPRLYLWLLFALMPRAARRSLSPLLKSVRSRLPSRLWLGRIEA